MKKIHRKCGKIIFRTLIFPHLVKYFFANFLRFFRVGYKGTHSGTRNGGFLAIPGCYGLFRVQKNPLLMRVLYSWKQKMEAQNRNEHWFTAKCATESLLSDLELLLTNLKYIFANDATIISWVISCMQHKCSKVCYNFKPWKCSS